MKQAINRTNKISTQGVIDEDDGKCDIYETYESFKNTRAHKRFTEGFVNWNKW